MPSKRNLEKRLGRLEEARDDYPEASLCQIFGYLETMETVDEERNLVRLNGEVMRIPDEMLQKLLQ